MWNHLCALLDIKVRHTSAFHPQANGQAERSNQTMKALLRITALHDEEPMAEMAMNSAPIAHTEFSPFYLNCGYEPVFVPDVFSEAQAANARTETIQEFTERMETRWKVARQLLQELKEEQVRQGNRSRRQKICELEI